MIYKLEAFCDNLEEASSVFNNFLNTTKSGTPSNLKYSLSINGEGLVEIPIYGYYRSDLLPQKVKNFIQLLDKPDLILYDREKDSVLLAGEFTDTVSIGNSQWQRSGRVVSAAEERIPFIALYPSVGEDRDARQLREPTSLLILFFLNLIKGYQSKTFLVFKKDEYLQSLNDSREQKGLIPYKRIDGDSVVNDWIYFMILDYYKKDFESKLIKIEKRIKENMYLYLEEKTNGKTPRIKKDLAVPEGYDIKTIDPELTKYTTIDWKGIKGKKATTSYFQQNFMKDLIELNPKTYISGAKFSIVQDTVELIALLDKHYNFKNHSSLNKKFSTLILPIQGYQKEGVLISDPNSGEVAAFPILFGNIPNKKMNIIYFIYGTLPKNWKNIWRNETNKLFRGIVKFGDVLCYESVKNDMAKPDSEII